MFSTHFRPSNIFSINSGTFSCALSLTISPKAPMLSSSNWSGGWHLSSLCWVLQGGAALLQGGTSAPGDDCSFAVIQVLLTKSVEWNRITELSWEWQCLVYWDMFTTEISILNSTAIIFLFIFLFTVYLGSRFFLFSLFFVLIDVLLKGTYRWELSTVQRWAFNSRYWLSHCTLNF